MGSRKKNKRRTTKVLRMPGKTRRGEKRWIVAIAAVAFFGTAAFFFLRGERVTGPLNLVLVSVDTLRADHLSCYADSPVPTPHIDRLAEDGVVFESVQTVSPTTLPAHASLFTGLTPLGHGVRDNVGFYLPKTPPTLASVLGDAGYTTGGFVGAFVLDSRFGIDRGFETFFDRFDTAEENIAGGFVSQRRGEVVLDEALRWMEGAKAGPFFAFIHFYDPHTPYDPPPPFAPAEPSNPTLYAGEVAYVDSLVGRLTAWLDDRGLLDQTVLVLTSDHGEALGEHGEQTHGFFLYESALRVPLIIRYPGVKRGRRVGGLARLIDVMPTLLDLLGLSPPNDIEGRSLRPWMERQAASLDRPAYAETYVPRLHYGWSELRSLRKGPYKLILAPRPELYQLEQDPAESRNLVQEQPDLARRLREELEVVLAQTRQEMPQADRLDPETREKLRALGYAGHTSGARPDRPFSELPDPKDRISVYETINDPQLTDVSPEDGERFQKALMSLRSVLDEDPAIPRAYILYGELLLKVGRATEAARSFEQAIELHQESFAATYGLAMAEVAMGRLDRAATYLRRATTIEPENAKSYFQLAELEKTRGDLAAAEQWLRRAIDIHPDRALQEKLAEILIETGRTAEAEELLTDMVRRYGEDAISLYNRGQILLRNGQAIEATEYLTRASQLSPRDADIRLALGSAFAASGNTQAAMAELHRAIEISPCLAGAHLNLGTAYHQLGRIDDAVQSFQKAIECDPEYARAYTNLASVFLQMGQPNRAVEALRRAVALTPDDQELRRVLSDLEAQLRR